MSSSTTADDDRVPSGPKKGFNPSPTFLSGDGDEELRSRRQKRLGELVVVGAGASPNEVISGIGGETPAVGRGVRIEVVEETTSPEVNDMPIGPKDGGESSDDDEPPPISLMEAAAAAAAANGSVASSQSPTPGPAQKSIHDGAKESLHPPSLMEEMMAAAANARTEKAKRSEEAKMKSAKSASFGVKKGFLNSKSSKSLRKAKLSRELESEENRINEKNDIREADGKRGGFQKGFLDRPKNGVPSRKTKGNGRSKTDSNEDEVFEIDAEGNLVKASAHQKVEIPTIRPKERADQPTDQDRLQLKEVQEAMKNDPAEKLAGGEWVTESLLQKVAENPRLAAGLSNPKFTAALKALQENPREAMAKFKDKPEITDFLHEFCGVMGEHFTKLGAEQDQSRKVEEVKRLGASKLGPLAQAALEKEAERTSRGQTLWDKGMSREEREKMDCVLADQELTAILMDPDMQQAMQECAVPGRMKMFMQHPDYGVKLRKLISAGLLKVEH